MKLEHRRDKVVPLNHFFKRVARYVGVAFILIIFSLGIGTLGYHHFGDCGWLDSFHMSCMILTGMGPVSEMRSAGANYSLRFTHFTAV